MQAVVNPTDVLGEVSPIFKKQQAFYNSGKTLDYKFRVKQIKKLKKAIKDNEEAAIKALNYDLGKAQMEAYTTEVGFMYPEIEHVLANLKEWMRPEHVATPLALAPSSSKIMKRPLGQVLIIGPWNYPFQLMLAVLLPAIAAGNTAILKPSEFTPATNEVIKKIISDTFDEEYIAIVEGEGHVVLPPMIDNLKFNHIFFTGSVPVGAIIAEQAARHLIPCTLELGGKSPAIVDETANINIAAKRIVWGKFTNAGQTCVAPDYVLVHNSKKQQLVDGLKKHIVAAFGENPHQSADYGRIINERRFDALTEFLAEGNILYGGENDKTDKFIAPTLLDNVHMEDKVMKEEIFGPILPILTYENLDEVIDIIRQNSHPLALYLFTNKSSVEEKVMSQVAFGGGCVNDCLMHLGNPDLPFGGVGTSGQGSYHGKYGFDTFSHNQSIIKTPTLIDVPVRYAPFTNLKEKMVRMFLG